MNRFFLCCEMHKNESISWLWRLVLYICKLRLSVLCSNTIYRPEDYRPAWNRLSPFDVDIGVHFYIYISFVAHIEHLIYHTLKLWLFLFYWLAHLMIIKWNKYSIHQGRYFYCDILGVPTNMLPKKSIPTDTWLLQYKVYLMKFLQ